MKASLFIFLVGLTSFVARGLERGQALYQSRCVTCHGGDARGLQGEKAPSLRGQYDWYLVSSLQKFVAGERKHPLIVSGFQSLSGQDFKHLADYLSQLK